MSWYSSKLLQVCLESMCMFCRLRFGDEEQQLHAFTCFSKQQQQGAQTNPTRGHKTVTWGEHISTNQQRQLQQTKNALTNRGTHDRGLSQRVGQPPERGYAGNSLVAW